MYRENLITDAYIIGSVAKGTAKKESDIDILIINPLFEVYLEELSPDEELENIKKVVDKLKDMGVERLLIYSERGSIIIGKPTKEAKEEFAMLIGDYMNLKDKVDKTPICSKKVT